jgi:glycosyltransferase involved in cell wall biosynthesis
MKVLGLSPYHGGSHAQFLDQWLGRSHHDWQLLTLPARHFKWRIRQGAVGLAQEASRLAAQGHQFDLIWTTSLLDAAELRGLLPGAMRELPLVVYFHENQFEYPVRKVDERDIHFGLINWVSALCAEQVWFNSDFNRQSFFSGVRRLLRKMPDENCLSTLDDLKQKTRVEFPGAELDESFAPFLPGPLHIAWVGRWEHDKRPDLFFSALRILKQQNIDFRISLLGQRFRVVPPEFQRAQADLAGHIVEGQFLSDRSEYFRALRAADVVVSTADHEFFGLALLEAVSAGCIPVVPDRLVYPELYNQACLYAGDANSLAGRLCDLARLKELGAITDHRQELGLSGLVARYQMRTRVTELDQALQNAAGLS